MLKAFLLVLILAAASSIAASDAIICGYVLENETEKTLDDIVVEARSVDGLNKYVALNYTNLEGYYCITVPPGEYNIYVKLGKENPKKTVAVKEGEKEQADFMVNLRDRREEKEGGNYLYLMVFLVLLLVVVLFYLIHVRKRTQLKQTKEEVSGESNKYKEKDELTILKEESKRLMNMISVARREYEERKITEERLNELVSDYTQSLNEVNKKISELESI